MKIKAPQAWLTAALEASPCSIMRIRAAQALATLANPDAVAVLGNALREQAGWWVRLEVAGSLAEAGGSTARGILVQALEGEEDLRVRTAIVKLSRVRDSVMTVCCGGGSLAQASNCEMAA